MALILSSSDAFASTRLAVYKGVGGKAKKTKQKEELRSKQRGGWGGGVSRVGGCRFFSGPKSKPAQYF